MERPQREEASFFTVYVCSYHLTKNNKIWHDNPSLQCFDAVVRVTGRASACRTQRSQIPGTWPNLDNSLKVVMRLWEGEGCASRPEPLCWWSVWSCQRYICFPLCFSSFSLQNLLVLFVTWGSVDISRCFISSWGSYGQVVRFHLASLICVSFRHDNNIIVVFEQQCCCVLQVEWIDPLCFLVECRKRRLNQALSVLCLSLGFFWECFVLLTSATFCVVLLFYILSLGWAG